MNCLQKIRLACPLFKRNGFRIDKTIRRMRVDREKHKMKRLFPGNQLPVLVEGIFEKLPVIAPPMPGRFSPGSAGNHFIKSFAFQQDVYSCEFHFRPQDEHLTITCLMQNPWKRGHAGTEPHINAAVQAGRQMTRCQYAAGEGSIHPAEREVGIPGI